MGGNQLGMAALLGAVLIQWLGLEAGQAAEALLRLVRVPPTNVNLVQNGDFHEVTAGTPVAWHAAPSGFGLALGEGRRGGPAVVCQNPATEGWFGVSQTVALDRTNAAPLVVRGWSKAEGVSGGTDNGYALYVDLIYADGTFLWGQTADFHCGTHDWERRETIILPEKPVKSLTLYCLFRGHTGKVWFDDIELTEVQAQGDAVVFQGVPVQVAPPARHPRGKVVGFATRDGLRLGLRDAAVSSVQVEGTELAVSAPGGFLVRDVDADSDWYGFTAGWCPELGLKLAARVTPQADCLRVQGRLSNLRGGDRAVTLIFALPVDLPGGWWGDDLRRSRTLGGRGEFSNVTTVRCGATGTMSLYPVGAVWNSRAGLALGLDMNQPAQYRFAYHAGTHQLLLAYDYGLVPEPARFPGAAEFSFVVFRFAPRWGFRAAWEKFMRVFPEDFRVRSKDQGIWMPFTDVSTVQGWEDFGFKYHEGNNNVVWDDAHGILSFRYTEPMTWWMPLPKGAPRRLPEAVRRRDELAHDGPPASRSMAQAAQAAAMTDETGQPAVLFRDTPWCDGAVWSLNPNPDLPATPNAATVHWNDTIQDQLYGLDTPGQLDGEYLDSLEGYVTADLNFNRAQFGWTSVPLTFTTDTHRPALFKGLAVFEFTRWLAADVHRLDKLMFANGVPYRFSFLCPSLDVLGTETDWLRDGRFQPVPDSQLCLWRTLAGAKPYLLLMNTDFAVFGPEEVERYFAYSLFYGMFPSMFSHNAADNPYWRNPAWYNRDRVLFKRYQPLIKQVAEAGWRPETGAESDNPQVWLERFGPTPGGVVYLTAFNATAQRQPARVRVDSATEGLAGRWDARELLTGQHLRPAEAGWGVTLEPHRAAVFRLRPLP